MIYILHDLKDPKLWELWYTAIVGNTGFMSSTVVSLDPLGFVGTINPKLQTVDPKLVPVTLAGGDAHVCQRLRRAGVPSLL